MADTDEKSYSGELFDLSIPSINDKFGAMHIIGVMQYGINFPLSKFIKELQLIIASGTDDKTAKRQERLKFLMHCNGNKELRKFFILFCNYLNGRDGDGTQWSNYMVITAAGGNIMILFAQLIKDIIEKPKTNLMSSNKILLEELSKLTITPDETIIDSIKIHFAMPEMLEMLQEVAESEASDCDFKLSPNIIPVTDNTAVDIISRMFRELEIESAIGGNAKIGGVNPFTNPFGSYRDGPVRMESESLTSQSSQPSQSSMPSQSQSSEPPFHDLEDDLSPSNLEQLITQLKIRPDINIVKLAELFAKIKIDATSDVIGIHEQEEFIALLMFLYKNIGSNTEVAGFLLYRIKTLILNLKNHKPTLTAKQMKTYKADCSKEQQQLYPQIIQQQDLNDIPDKNSGCFQYLTYLMEKKKIIRWLTTLAVNEIINFYRIGDYKRSNQDGTQTSIFEHATNPTDALIKYIRTVTSNTNVYIGQWLTGKFSHDTAPGYWSGDRFTISYIHVCRNFSSLEKIVSGNNGMIPRLCVDILYYFLNYPNYNSETILDNILKSFNRKRSQAKKQPSGMPPSTIHLIQFQSLPIDSTYLELSKVIIQDKLDETGDKLGIPDGVNITINPVMTDGIITDIEYIKNIARQMDFTNELHEKTISKGIKKPTPKLSKGGNKYYKKNITLKNKKIKHKTRKHKSKKHKTRKHKM